MSSVWSIAPAVILAALALALPNANASGEGTPVELTIDGEHIYWAGVESGSAGGCTGFKAVKILNRTALAGITADILANGGDCGDGRGIVVDGSHVYWVTSNVSPNE